MKYTEYTDEQIQEIKCQRDRRKRQQITVIVFILGVLFALVGRAAAGGSHPQGTGGESQETGCSRC